ncbi:DNA-binding response regulator [Streptomyces lydicus]|uniref:DNA-binding response regulator n=1 Tax=Streptomyces lydicus TaxID=47763 RepID=UPI001011D9CA|nr:DNA-binding response regulator [Streptomyces lydicus]MCZ1011834.1 DNA-binding response regulator [Streptomyces lydicus]
MHQHASTTTELHVLAHSGLKAHFDSPHAPLSTLRSGLDCIDFVDGGDLTAPGRALDLPVLLPVTSEFQVEELRAIRVRHPLSLLIAVTSDISGYRTYYAIRSGANFVLNLAIPGKSQIDMLYAQLRVHRMTSPAETTTTWLQAIPADQGGRHHGNDDGEPAPRTDVDREAHITGAPLRPTLPTYDTELMRLLCTSTTVSEIARRYFCSERSMYRRIRRLYDDLGVGSRAELMSLRRARLEPTR